MVMKDMGLPQVLTNGYYNSMVLSIKINFQRKLIQVNKKKYILFFFF